MKHLLSLIASSLVATLAAAANNVAPCPCPCISVTQQCCPDLFKSSPVTYTTYGEFLYMQPNFNNLYYGASAIGINYDDSHIAAVASPNWTILQMEPDYHPGFEIGVRCTLDDANLQIGANWEWLHGNDSDSFQTSSLNGYMVGPFWDIGPNSASYKIARGKLDSQFDAVNLTFARELCFFNNFHTRFYGAAAFIRIKQDLRCTYSNLSDNVSRVIDNTSTFLGAGPQVGVDYDYRMYKSFFFSGSSVLSMIMGQMQNTESYQSYTPVLTGIGLSQPNNQRTTVPDRAQLVPGFEQKLGFTYLATWNRVRATLEIGYRCQAYLNAVQNFNMISQVLSSDDVVAPQAGLFAVAFQQDNSNFMLTGPYAYLGFEF